MQNVKKVDIENKNNHKRNRRRKRNMTGYYFLVAFLAAGIAASLSVTLLFNVHEVVISGMTGSSYSETEIISSAGISRGDNLVRMNTVKIKDTMMNDLLFIDDVEIKKSFPDKVLIDITPSIECAYVECKGGYALISENWRIIGQTEEPEKSSLIIVRGFDCKSNEEKTIIESKDPDKSTALKEILDEIKKQNIKKMVSVDISDKYDVELNYDNRIKICIEKPVDIEYKLRYAYKIITDELRENKNGYLIYRNSLGYSYVSEEEYNRINGGFNLPVLPDAENSGESMVTGVSDNPEVSITGNEIAEPAVTESYIPAVTSAATAQQVGW